MSETVKPQPSHTMDELKRQVAYLSLELNRIYSSRSWQIFSRLRDIWKGGLPATVFRLTANAYRDSRRRRNNRKTRRQIATLDFGRGVDIRDQLDVHFGRHRSGWVYVLNALSVLDKKGGIYMDTFVERTFGWNEAAGKAHLKEWLGICHVPNEMPEWLPEQHKKQTFSCFSRNVGWGISAAHCVGLFTLSEDHAKKLRQLTEVPVNSLVHPTEIPEIQWSIDAFAQNMDRKVIQIGWWLRNFHAFFGARFEGYRKVLLQITSDKWLKDYLNLERGNIAETIAFDDTMLKTVEVMAYIENKAYDMLLSKNIVFLNLYNSSANNTVIECIARGTPLLINRLPAVVEYLGESYPMYYSSLEEAEAKSKNYELLEATSLYLRRPELRERLSIRYFLESLVKSSIYKSVS